MSASEILPILQSIEKRLAAIESKMGGNLSSNTVSVTGECTVSDDLPRSIKGFDEYCSGALDPFVVACSKIGGDAEKAGKLVAIAWGDMRSFLLMASKCKEPPAASIPPLLSGIVGTLKEVSSLTQRNEFERHMKTISEGAGCLNWLLVKPAPRDFIESFIGGADYWANNIRKEFRTTNPDQIAFCDSFKKLLTDLMAYVKEYHTTGVAWNPKGIDTQTYTPGSSPSPSTAPADAPKPTTTAAKPGGNMFAELNKGGAITSGLKTVTKDMQTWRKEFKADEAAPAPAAKKATVAPRVGEQVKGPPKLEYQAHGAKWLVENQSSSVVVDITDIKQNVYIFGCIGATIDIRGKCKSIILDTCKKTRVSFDEVFSTCETVNSARIQIECRDKCAACAIDKTDGIVIILPTTSLDTSIVASKSSEMNIQWPGPDGEMLERPIPEQYVHKISGTSVTADVSDLYSH